MRGASIHCKCASPKPAWALYSWEDLLIGLRDPSLKEQPWDLGLPTWCLRMGPILLHHLCPAGVHQLPRHLPRQDERRGYMNVFFVSFH